MKHHCEVEVAAAAAAESVLTPAALCCCNDSPVDAALVLPTPLKGTAADVPQLVLLMPFAIAIVSIMVPIAACHCIICC